MNKECSGGFERIMQYFRHDLYIRGVWEEEVKGDARWTKRGRETYQLVTVLLPGSQATQTSDELATNPPGVGGGSITASGEIIQ